MRILILNWDYSEFLSGHYAQRPELSLASYAKQMAARNDSLFGVANFYSQGLIAWGHEAAEIHANNMWLQQAWAREHGLSLGMDIQANNYQRFNKFTARLKHTLQPYRTLLAPLAQQLGLMQKMHDAQKEILLAQIEEYNPDIILNQSVEIDTRILRSIKRKGRTIIAQIGVTPPAGLDFDVYDLGISQVPWIVEHFRKNGLRAERQHLAFEPAIIDKLGRAPQKDIPLSFVGSLASSHQARITLLEAVANRFPLALWAPDLNGLSVHSPLHACFRGQVYGNEMYDVLRRSQITLNSHISAAKGSAANMRLFEATGVGCFLLTDNMVDLPMLFEPNTQVGVYKDIEDCLEKIERYLAAPTETNCIANAGQAHTIQHHTYHKRVRQLLDFIENSKQ